MTDEKIIKALGNCIVMSKSLREDTLNLITQQRATIENYSITEKDLRYRNKELQRANKKQAEYIEELESELRTGREIRAEAIKEFAERLKDTAEIDDFSLDGKKYVFVGDIDDIAKEMIE